MNKVLDYLINRYYNEYYTEIVLNPDKPDLEEFKISIFHNSREQISIVNYLKKMNIFNVSKILILGCGPGRLERCVFDIIKPNNLKIFAIEPYDVAIKISNYLKLERKINNLYYIQAAGETLPFKDNYFDAVISNQVLEHVQNLDKVCLEIMRILKPGGVTYHICPNFRSFYEGHYKIFWLPVLSKRILSYYLKLRGLSDKVLYSELNLITPKKLKKIFSNAGFKNINTYIFKQSLIFKIYNSDKINNEKIKKIINLIYIFKIKHILAFFIKIWPFFNVTHIYAQKGK